MGIELKIKGNTYSTWKYVKIGMSIESLAGFFIGTFPDNLATEISGKELNIGMGDEFTVCINGWTVVTGYIDQIISTYGIRDDGETNIGFSIVGRDKTADLIDCSFGETVNEFKGLSALAIIRKVCAPFNITVKVDEAVNSALSNKKFVTYKANEGDSPFDMISRLCRMVGVLPLSYGDGKLTLTKATDEASATDPIILGENARYVRLNNDNINRFSNYIVKGQGISTDDKATADYVSPSGYCMDSVIDRNRPLVIFAEEIADSGDCAERARWISRIRAGKSRALVYTMQGLSQSDRSVWYPNMLAQVIDNYHRITDTMLISDVEYTYEEKGKDIIENTKLTLVDENTYDSSSTEKIRNRFDRV
jgi:prophage tail gpP-like protein